ncbi:MAG: prolipoprotein diacylglyceryl transferase [Bacteroidales bacterium]
MKTNQIIWNVDPEIFHISNIPIIGDLAFRWYSLSFALSFTLGYIILRKMFKAEDIQEKKLDSLFFYVFFSTIIGARLGHILFYQPDYYLVNPWEILMIWRGGLASHGAAFGILIGIFIFSKKFKLNVLSILDKTVIVIALAGMLIRLGNLMNSEIYGDITNLPWGFVFVIDSGFNSPAHHPTQIYEAICYLLTFIFLYNLYWKKNKSLGKGSLFAIFLICIFGTRFGVEFIKEPQVFFEKNMLINMGQILSIPFVLTGGFILWRNKKA